MNETRLSSGNLMALACGPLKRQRYINPKIELELIDFKKEIEEKFEKSPLRSFSMPRRSVRDDNQRNMSPDAGSNVGSANIFTSSRMKGGGPGGANQRLLAQSTDATVMQSYLN